MIRLGFLKTQPQRDLLRIRVQGESVRQALAKLPPRLNENVRKRAARRVLSPYVKELAGRWLRASFRGPSAKHRLAISAATELDVRRAGSGPSAPIRARIGVRYGKRAKAAALARGRQRIFHLLENGFRHKNAKRKVTGRFISFAWARSSLARIMQQLSDQTLVEAHKELAKLGRSGA